MSVNKFLLTMACIMACLCAIVVWRRPLAEDAATDQARRFAYDEPSGVYRLVYADGREEIECANGARRPLYRIRKLLPRRGWDHVDEVDLLRTIPPRCFPVIVTFEKRGDPPLIFSVVTGEVFYE